VYGLLFVTTFEVNLRTMFLDRGQFDGSEGQARAIGGWVGVKTGYFLDDIAFGATLYTSQPIYAPDDRGHGGGFGGPDWSVRISLANSAEDTYPKIGLYLREAAKGYVKEWEATKKSGSK
jgi:hypothetical protein